MRRWFSGCFGGGATTCKRSDHPLSPTHHRHPRRSSEDPEQQQLSGRPLKSILKKSPSDGLDGSFSPSSVRYRYLPPSRRPRAPLSTHVVLQPYGKRRGGRQQDFGPAQRQTPGQFNTHFVRQPSERRQVVVGGHREDLEPLQSQERGPDNTHVFLQQPRRSQVFEPRQRFQPLQQRQERSRFNTRFFLQPPGRRQVDPGGRQEGFRPLQRQERGRFNTRLFLQPPGRRQVNPGERQEGFQPLQRQERGPYIPVSALQPSERRSYGGVLERLNAHCLVPTKTYECLPGSRSQSLDSNVPELPGTREACLNIGDTTVPERCNNSLNRNPWNALPSRRQHRLPLSSYFGARSRGGGRLSSWGASSVQGRRPQFLTSTQQRCLPPQYPRLPATTGRQVISPMEKWACMLIVVVRESLRQPSPREWC